MEEPSTITELPTIDLALGSDLIAGFCIFFMLIVVALRKELNLGFFPLFIYDFYKIKNDQKNQKIKIIYNLVFYLFTLSAVISLFRLYRYLTN